MIIYKEKIEDKRLKLKYVQKNNNIFNNEIRNSKTFKVANNFTANNGKQG